MASTARGQLRPPWDAAWCGALEDRPPLRALRHWIGRACAALLLGATAGLPTAAADTPAAPPATTCRAGSGAALLQTVRLGRARTGSTITFTFENNRLPRYRLRYVVPPITEDPSGRTVRVAGSRFLEIRMQPASGVDLGGARARVVYHGPRRIPGPRGSALRELVRTGDFEAVLTWVAGLDRRGRLSVGTACGPARLVVRIR